MLTSHQFLHGMPYNWYHSMAQDISFHLMYHKMSDISCSYRNINKNVKTGVYAKITVVYMLIYPPCFLVWFSFGLHFSFFSHLRQLVKGDIIIFFKSGIKMRSHYFISMAQRVIYLLLESLIVFGFDCFVQIIGSDVLCHDKGPSINYIRIFSRFLDPPTPLVALSTHLNDPPPPLAYIQPRI